MPRLNPAVVMDSAMERWMIRRCHDNYWRVSEWMEIEDLVQEGHRVYADCRRRYKERVTDKRHFMALYKTCLNNHLTDLAAKRYRALNLVELEPGHNDARSDHSNAFLLTLMKEARYPVRAVFELFGTDKGIEFMRAYPQGQHERPNHYLCRLLGLDPKQFNLPGLVRSFLDGKGSYFLNGAARDPVIS